jgi:UDPglucose 6-dehydrogenase
VDPLVPSATAQAIYGIGTTPLNAALQDAHAVVLVTDHKPIRELGVKDLKAHVAPGCLVVDTRNHWRPDEVRAAGFRYRGVGRPAQ